MVLTLSGGKARGLIFSAALFLSACAPLGELLKPPASPDPSGIGFGEELYKLQGRVDYLYGYVKRSEQRLTLQAADIQRGQGDLGGLPGEVAALRKDVLSLHDEIAGVRSNAVSAKKLDEAVSKLRSSAEKESSRAARFESQVKERKESYETILTKLSALSDGLAELRKKVVELERSPERGAADRPPGKTAAAGAVPLKDVPPVEVGKSAQSRVNEKSVQTPGKVQQGEPSPKNLKPAEIAAGADSLTLTFHDCCELDGAEASVAAFKARAKGKRVSLVLFAPAGLDAGRKQRALGAAEKLRALFLSKGMPGGYLVLSVRNKKAGPVKIVLQAAR